MPFTADAITLSSDEQSELEQMTQSRTLPAGDVFRARLILMLAEGVPVWSKNPNSMKTRSGSHPAGAVNVTLGVHVVRFVTSRYVRPSSVETNSPPPRASS